ncbi:ABC-three component system protein [Thiohalomonas denitrificans]|uniref:ABC-three component system protein n=1 Tax=Thiohalomonas denitrificans TaxID=415747 RepID=UPI0026EBC8A8|nr:ABC-three component system protein [Thiohalomonas denitrificans]
MIHRIYSDLPSFKELQFTEGLNILLAQKSEGATERHTRNRAGKSSMLEMVHFLLGSNASKDSLFRTPAIADYEFGMEFDLAEERTLVQRRGAKASPLAVEGDFSAWPVKPRLKDGRYWISNKNWRLVLGALMFGLEDYQESWTPSFRSMISYFARRERSGGMHVPVKQSEKQATADQQVNLSYLLELDWTIPLEWQQVRERERNLAELKKSLKKGSFGQVIDKASTLKTQVLVAEDRANRLKEQVATFTVVDEYHDLEQEASRMTTDLAALADENTLDHRYISDLERAMEEEIPPSPPDLQRLYREAGVVLPDVVQRRFDDVKSFHESVLQNRKSYLQTELAAAKRRIAERGEEQQRLDARRGEIMQILNANGALDHFTALQAEIARAEVELESLRKKYETADALESGTTKLKVERARLQERLREDYTEQQDVVKAAILTFQRISSSLYEDKAAGSLTLTPTENGPEFEIEIQGAKSRGVSNMQIFCFDMMLTLLSIERGRSPGFLIHDSHLFDGVDERQVGTALALGARLAEEHGFQYIVSLNTDDVPTEVPDGFSIEEHTLDVRLSDATEEGGLFGFRFG